MSRDVVTLSLFGMQARWKADEEGVKKLIDSQVANVIEMKKSFDQAAKESGRNPPEIVLSALMIPQWKSGDNYTDQNYTTSDYLRVKEEYFGYLKEKCEAAGIQVQDFYSEAATSDEKEYLNQLEALGSSADLIKNRAIINNQGNRHLQIDTNTIIVDRKAFYKATIGAEAQKDGMNASYYDDSGEYVSPHNKVVYTCEASEFTKNLKNQHDAYVNESKDKLDRKTPSSNQIYSTGFCKAALDSGLVDFNRKYYQQWNNLWGYYPVNLDHPTFQMTSHIITAINMSWSQGGGKVDYCAALKDIKVPVLSESRETTNLDFQSFSYLIKKYTNPKLSETDRENLLKISDTDYDTRAINSFVGSVIEQRDVSLLGPLLRTIPETQEGNKIRKQLFEAFKNNDDFLSIVQNANIDDKVTPADLVALAKFLPNDVNEKNILIQKSESLIDTRKNELQGKLLEMKEEIYTVVKGKLDTLGAPYTFTELDKKTISTAVDVLSQDGVKDQTLKQFQQVAQNMAINAVLNNKLKMQPAIIAALEHADLNVKKQIMSKVYPAPINEKFNTVEVNAMVNRIAFDVKILMAAPAKKAFFENTEVNEFVKKLNELAAVRPMNTETEIQVERMSGAIKKAVGNFVEKPDVVEMSKHLQDIYESIESPNSVDMSYSDIVSAGKQVELVTKVAFTTLPSQAMKEKLQVLMNEDSKEDSSENKLSL